MIMNRGPHSPPISSTKMIRSSEKFFTLIAAQRLFRTDNGEEINNTQARLMDNKGLERMKNDKKLSIERKLVLMLPFSIVSKIVERVYLGGLASLTIENFLLYSIRLVINASHDLPLLKETDIESYRVPVNDEITGDLLMYFDDVSDKIYEFLQKFSENSVLIHCMAGVSRSTTLVIAYLIKYHKMTTRDAFKLVKTIRPFIRPNIAFIGQLMAFEEKLNDFCTSKIIKIYFDNHLVRMPSFYENDHPELYKLEIRKQTDGDKVEL
ncbi:dual specificity protein phosphatase 21-like isoform X2 [Dermatophagoides farinae]|uniref:dual specificity protein phosphatase 21-like isoform X2 n=1 Tax=Dermatophagoides farinae TaxID=6954 RepID=UPI001F0E87EB|nr:dual specificity protein phosphatase 21-like [Dermatophagoides farinae]